MITKLLLLYIFRHDLIYVDFETVFNQYFLTYAEVANRCNTSEAVVEAWVNMGRLSKIRLKNENYIPVTDLEELLKTMQN